MNDPYVQPNGVLRNRLGITDAATLATAEADITRARILQVDEHPPPGDFDLAHLRRFHASIFSDLYDWAGELRTVDIAKRTPFCPLQHLPASDHRLSLRESHWNSSKGCWDRHEQR
ncbi:hypothetical protein [Streptomyces vastus]|uniref:protein adenylyltransferase n=1 Tax=Streptomyces vastus TaxID=285451 RepID=A0ABP6E7P8_9ACTN